MTDFTADEVAALAETAPTPPTSFAVVAEKLLASGWLPHPVPRGAKGPPELDCTGFHATTDPDEWADRVRNDWLTRKGLQVANTAVRLPPNVIGLDVDDYPVGEGDKLHIKRGDKHLETFRQSRDLPELPKTVRISARSAKTPSGVRLYRIPESMRDALDGIGATGKDSDDPRPSGPRYDLARRQGKLPSQPCPDVELIHSGHRYVMNPGSLHPDTRSTYTLLGKSGKVRAGKDLSSISPDDLPELPEAWGEALLSLTSAARATREGSTAPGSIEADREAGAEAIEEWLAEHSECDMHDAQAMPSVGLTQAMGKFREYQNNATLASALLPLLATLVEDVEISHRSGELSPDPVRVLSQVRADYVRHGSAKDRPGEFNRALAWVFPIALASNDLSDSSPLIAWAQRTLEDDFWERTPVLASCRDFARSRIVAPQALLGCALAIVSSWLPPHIVLPAIVGGEVGLSFFVAICAESGGGKSAAMSAAKDWLQVVPHEKADLEADEPLTVTTATGEGLSAALTSTERVKVDGSWRQIPRQHHRSVRFDVDEIETLGVSMGREGASIRSFLKTMWMGKSPSTYAATSDRTRILHDHEFRVAMTAGVQPEHAAVLLSDAAGGFPQRWLWIEAYDPHPLTDDELDRLQEESPPECYVWRVPRAAHPLPQIVDSDGETKAGKPIPGQGDSKIFLTPAEASDRKSTGPREVLDVTRRIVEQVRAAQRQTIRIGEDVSGKSDGERLDGHRILVLEKTAALLAALHGHIGITEEYEDMAEWLMAQSDATRARVLVARNKREEEHYIAQAKREGRRSAVARRAEAEAEKADLETRITAEVRAAGGELPFRDLSRRFNLSRAIGSMEDQVEAIEALDGMEVVQAKAGKGGRMIRIVRLAGMGEDDGEEEEG